MPDCRNCKYYDEPYHVICEQYRDDEIEDRKLIKHPEKGECDDYESNIGD